MSNNSVPANMIKKAEEIRDRLISKLGGDWQIKYSNNLGWSFTICLGTIQVHYNEGLNEYFTHLNDSYIGSGTPMYYWGWSHKDTPEESVTVAVEYSRKKIVQTLEVLDNNISMLTNYNLK